MLLKLCFLTLTVVLFIPKGNCLFSSSSDIGLNGIRKAPRWNFPFLGFGLRCNGCPPRGCEDDEAIIHGYCCGCAYPLDKLPVLCPQFLQCPLNLHGLCHDYEYMMRCCC
ncbi:PREDICTED: uncharacterized protein LOC106120079 [Papilio xuthus]|uniref:Uncharacterized protein LOC106120079 n=1 Tax=Papilio xuthus TaxID=66420 RepID=A0AAJ7EBJ6_PAPXU|nr:PREDICTED: uncharacterized protein LOC106120079 [Papilio xuthus]